MTSLLNDLFEYLLHLIWCYPNEYSDTVLLNSSPVLSSTMNAITIFTAGLIKIPCADIIRIFAAPFSAVMQKPVILIISSDHTSHPFCDIIAQDIRFYSLLQPGPQMMPVFHLNG